MKRPHLTLLLPGNRQLAEEIERTKGGLRARLGEQNPELREDGEILERRIRAATSTSK